MSDEIVYRGKLFQVINRTKENTFLVDGKEITKNLTFELVRRPPGVRALIVQDNKLLLNKEYRYELDDWDYRLPGGKVFDKLEQFEKALVNDSIENSVDEKLKEELREEADIEVLGYNLFGVSKSGLTVDWTLYYFLVDKFKILPSFYEKDKQKSEYEYIQHVWVNFDDVMDLFLNDKISEDRSAAMILKYILRKK